MPAGFMTHHVYFMNLGAGGPAFGTGLTANRTGTTQLGTGVQPPAPPAPRTR